MAPQADGTRKLLIVEDDPVAQKILSSVAERAGYSVAVCADAESGWRYFEAETPRLVVLDWLLAGMDGVTLCKKIRESAKGRFITILMTTVQERPQDFEEALKAGVTYYMVKPIRREFFAAWLSAARKGVEDLLQLEEQDRREADYRAELENLNEQMEEALSRANALAMEAEQAYIEIKQIFKTVAGGILLIDSQYNILRHNEAFLQMAGVSAEDARTGKCYDIFPSVMCNSPDCPLQKVRQGGGRCESEVEALAPDGSTVHYHIISTPFRGPAGDFIGIVEHITDITARVKAEKALQESEQRYKELSIVDELTRLFNKRHFNHHLELETERAKRYHLPLSLLLMDIDNFKHHNDTYGHADGDRVLARLGRIVAESIRLNDLGCRYGGEEFTVILPNTSGKDALVVAERIRARFAEEVFLPVPDQVVHKTVSVGIAEYRPDEKKEELLERADQNMYAAKQGGKNRVVFQ
ncbi:MAG: diguanylate cyclase [Thermodesulfobacteriota bacterium]